jgi:hypothetical protein
VITTRTVFVLGAGASEPYGLPLGSRLRLDVLQNFLDTTGHSVQLYNTTEFVQRQTIEFTEAFRYSGFLSVDAFLERRPEFMEIGKAMMGIELLLRESGIRLWQEDRNWLTSLYQSMVGSTLGEFGDNSVSFVTFNYDRSVEHFLFTSLQNAFGRSGDEIKSVLEKIPIIHLHGRLGHLPWQEGNKAIPYGSTQIDGRTMKILRNEIKVVHEDITDGRDKDFAQAKELLGTATRVYLLGFGFGSKNVERLGLAEVKSADYQGTAVGLTPKEVRQCRSLCGDHINLHPNWDSLDFLRQIATLN